MKNYWLDDEPLPKMLCGDHRNTNPGNHTWLCINTDHNHDDRHYWVMVA